MALPTASSYLSGSPYQPVPVSDSYMGMFNSLAGQPTLAGALAGVRGTMSGGPMPTGYIGANASGVPGAAAASGTPAAPSVAAPAAPGATASGWVPGAVPQGRDQLRDAINAAHGNVNAVPRPPHVLAFTGPGSRFAGIGMRPDGTGGLPAGMSDQLGGFLQSLLGWLRGGATTTAPDFSGLRSMFANYGPAAGSPWAGLTGWLGRPGFEGGPTPAPVVPSPVQATPVVWNSADALLGH